MTMQGLSFHSPSMVSTADFSNIAMSLHLSQQEDGVRTCHNSKILCVRRLPDETDAAKLLEVLNQWFDNPKEKLADDDSGDNNNDEDAGTGELQEHQQEQGTQQQQQKDRQKPVQTAMVVGKVAAVLCSSSTVATKILRRARAISRGKSRRKTITTTTKVHFSRPIKYGGRVLKFGRPRNYYPSSKHSQTTH